MTLTDFALPIFAYVLGSIPFGVIVTHLAGTADIRKHGSGNIGATNVLRLAGTKLAIATLLLDCLKGAFAVYLATLFTSSSHIILLAGALSVVGHIFPVWLKFKGGKGVATMLAVLLTLSWPIGLAACVTWIITFAIFRISSLSSIMASIVAPLTAIWFTYLLLAPQGMDLLTLLLSSLVILRHKDNISRLLKGKEQRFKV